LKFAGAVGVGIIAAPFIGSISRFMPSYYYHTSSNSWKITYRRIFTPSEIALKSIWTPYVATIGKPELAYQTIRIDQQSQSEWLSSNPPHKYVTCKQVTATKI
jgi:hypothetical protein